jgi:hypothetical protein
MEWQIICLVCFEFLMRVIPTKVNYSVIDNMKNVIDYILKNKIKKDDE